MRQSNEGQTIMTTTVLVRLKSNLIIILCHKYKCHLQSQNWIELSEVNGEYVNKIWSIKVKETKDN